ncbi:MAG TPA: hypothetical protein VFA63_01025, partial [Pseudonocardiaceae bacterium]|nr:hypothetical protein [Pseudonocardiaceae bacterium]
MSKAWVGATALMLSGCWQAASLGEPPPRLTTGGQSTAAITNTGGQTGSGSTGTTGGSTSAGAGTATTTGASLCGPCAPGALCVDGECRCQDGAICAGDSTNYCYAGTCEACERGSLFGDSCLISLASQLNDPGCIAVDSQYVYWADNASVQRVLINGGPPQYIATIHSAGCLAIDSQNVYFTDQGSQTVQSAPLGGTGGSPPLARNQNNPYGIAVDSNYVYWADHFGQSV